MAKRYRVESVPNDTYKTLLQALSPYADETLNALESGNQKAFTDVLDAKGGLSTAERNSLINQFNQVQSSLPNRRDAIQNYIKSAKDESSLTDTELNDRLQAYKDLSGERINSIIGMQKLIDNYTNQVKHNWLDNKYDIDDKTARQIAEKAVNSKKAGNYDPQHVVDIYVSKYGRGREGNIAGFRDEGINISISKLIAQNLPDQIDANLATGIYNDSPGSLIDTSVDQTRLQQIIDARTGEANKTADYENYLKTAPKELSDARAGYYSDLSGGSLNFLKTRDIPDIMEKLNARGLATSGDVGAQIGARASDIEGQIESIMNDQESSDAQFFANAAYQLKTTQLTSSEADFRAALANSRQQALINSDQ